MYKREKPIVQWNAITYLYDFINTYLPLTYEEQKIYENLPVNAENITNSKEAEKTKDNASWTDWHLSRKLKEQGLVLCKGCGEVLPKSEFYGHMRYCKKCFVKRRKEDAQNNNA